MAEQSEYFSRIEVDSSAYSLVKSQNMDTAKDQAGKLLISSPRVLAFIMQQTL